VYAPMFLSIGNGGVSPFFGQSWFYNCTFYILSLRIECYFDDISELISSFSDIRTVFWCEIFQSFEYDCELTGLSENSIFILDKWLFGAYIHESRECTRFEVLECDEHRT
jgi:hypothetical protein